MKKQLYLIYSLLTVFLMVGYGCSEEDYLPSESERTHTVTLKLHIPEMEQVVMARAVDENAIGNPIAVYFKEGNYIAKKGIYTLDNNKSATLKVPVNTTSILVLANYGDTAPDDPKSEVITGSITNGNLPMWGETSISIGATTKEVSVSLYRAVAKMTLTNEAEAATFTDPEAKIFNIYDRSYLIGANEENDEINIPIDATLLPTKKDWDNNTYIIDSDPFYLFQTPCQTAQTRIVVKGKYKGTDYFYPIEMVQTDKDGYVTGETPVYLNILQNHAYEFIIKTVSGPGYSNLEDALKNPPLNMLVQIIDRRVEIFDMVANGSDELGVGNTVTIEAHGNSYGDEPDAVETKVFTTYTPTDDTFTQMQTPEIRYDEGQGEGWLTVTEAENYASDNEGTTGVMYTYKLQATSNPSTTPRTATLTFKVGLLERTLQVVQKGSSVLAALSDRNVWLYSGEQAGLIDEALITDNYFASLRQEGEHTPIYGTRAEDMQGVSRQGLIFNIIDTEDEFHENIDGSLVSSTLSYFIQRKDGDKITLYDGTGKYWTWIGGNGDIQEYYDGSQIIQGSSTGSDYFGINSTYGTKNGDVFYIWINKQALKKTGENTTEYDNNLLDYYLERKNGEMKVVITTAENIQIEIPIYVSGILHNLNGKNQIVKAGNSGPVKGWHYYEMVKQSDNTYIFDRNLGAKTNKRDAEGAYFYKKLKWKWENNQNVYDREESIISSILADTYNGGRLDILNIGFDSSSLLFDNGCPYLNNPTFANGFKVYFPLLKYLQGHCWIEEDEGVRYELKLPDGYPMGDQGGYYWRGGTQLGESMESKFWWNTYLFTDEGCDLTTSRITEEQGGRTELYYGMQIRPMYTAKDE